MLVPANKQKVMNTKSESFKAYTKLQKGFATKQIVPGQSPMGSEYKPVSDFYWKTASGESDSNESVLCMEDNGETHLHVEIEQN